MRHTEYMEFKSMSKYELINIQMQLYSKLNVIDKLLEVESKYDEIKNIRVELEKALEKEFGE